MQLAVMQLAVKGLAAKGLAAKGSVLKGLVVATHLKRATVACNHRRLFDDSGQATVEFAIVTFGFLAATLALNLVWRAVATGLPVQHALAVASHHVQSVAPAVLVDVFLF